jgi:Tfp pilus assembly ATPase PilU
MALEILIPNGAIRNLIREDKVHQIYSMMQTGQDKYGMQTFNQALATLYHKRQITLDTALQRSSNVDELEGTDRPRIRPQHRQRQQTPPEPLCPGPPNRNSTRRQR